jgi:hypothetical protein
MTAWQPSDSKETERKKKRPLGFPSGLLPKTKD